MKKIITTSLLCAGLLSTGALAKDSDRFIDRVKVGVNVGQISLDTKELKLDKTTVGFVVEAHKELLLDGLHFGLGTSAGFFSGSEDSFDLNSNLGVLVEGYGVVGYDILDNLYIHGKAGYASVDYADYNYNNDGMFYGAELEWKMTKSVAIGVMYNEYDIDEGDQYRAGVNLSLVF